MKFFTPRLAFSCCTWNRCLSDCCISLLFDFHNEIACKTLFLSKHLGIWRTITCQLISFRRFRNYPSFKYSDSMVNFAISSDKTNRHNFILHRQDPAKSSSRSGASHLCNRKQNLDFKFEDQQARISFRSHPQHLSAWSFRFRTTCGFRSGKSHGL